MPRPSRSKKRKRASSAVSPAQRKLVRALMGDYVLEDTHCYRADRHTFTIYVGGDPEHPVPGLVDGGSEPGVEYLMADRLSINLGVLSGINPKRPILIMLSSCGGHWDEGMQMFSSILTCPNPVTVLATKWARSMTSLIPLAADRFAIMPPAQYMFHHGSYGFDGLVQEAFTAHTELLRTREMMLAIYTTRLKEQGAYVRLSEKRIRTMLLEHMEKKVDVWLSADEAVEWGFADAVFDGNWQTVRATHKNTVRRARMLETLRTPIRVETKIS